MISLLYLTEIQWRVAFSVIEELWLQHFEENETHGLFVRYHSVCITDTTSRPTRQTPRVQTSEEHRTDLWVAVLCRSVNLLRVQSKLALFLCVSVLYGKQVDSEKYEDDILVQNVRILMAFICITSRWLKIRIPFTRLVAILMKKAKK